MKKGGNESREHFALKVMAVQWLWKRGFRAVAMEMDFHIHNVDVIGIKRVSGGSEVIVIEAKANRGDFTRELNAKSRLKSAQSRRVAAAAALEAEQTDRMSLGRRRTSEQARAYRQLRKAASTARRATYTHAKQKLYCDVLRERTSQRYVIASGPDVARKEEMPDGWGLIYPDPLKVVRACRKSAGVKGVKLTDLALKVASVSASALVMMHDHAQPSAGKWRWTPYADLIRE